MPLILCAATRIILSTHASRKSSWGLSSVVTCVQCQVGGSPVFILERKLGKGGFGQVYVGRRTTPTTHKEGPQANFVSVAAVWRCEGHVQGCAAVPNAYVLPVTMTPPPDGYALPAGGAQVRAQKQQGLQLWPALRVVCVHVSPLSSAFCLC